MAGYFATRMSTTDLQDDSRWTEVAGSLRAGHECALLCQSTWFVKSPDHPSLE